jgi:hypothetical protein
MENSPFEAPRVLRKVELSALDLRYESCRMKQAAREERLLGSIAERGVEEALEGMEVGETRILLNGFKRYRCARKLRIATVPYASLGGDEATGIIRLLRISHDKSLGIMEEAAFVDELKKVGNLSLAQIAAELSRSKAWVSLRLGLIGELSAAVRQRLFAGTFPVYAYLYTLRPFMRINGRAKEVDDFVSAVSGQGLSGREIGLLARGFFRGTEALRQEILQGHVGPVLARLQEVPASADGCSEFERAMLRDLEGVHRGLLRVMSRSDDKRLASGSFHAQSQLLTAEILSRGPVFLDSVKRLHDRGGQA